MTSPPRLDALLECLHERVALDALVLFGSRARDDAFRSSDWDLAVISSDFQGRDPLERGLMTVDCRRGGVEFVHLTPGELATPDFSYLRCAILEEGRALRDWGAFERARRRYRERQAAGEIEFGDGRVRFPESGAS